MLPGVTTAIYANLQRNDSGEKKGRPFFYSAPANSSVSFGDLDSRFAGIYVRIIRLNEVYFETFLYLVPLLLYL